MLSNFNADFKNMTTKSKDLILKFEGRFLRPTDYSTKFRKINASLIVNIFRRAFIK